MRMRTTRKKTRRKTTKSGKIATVLLLLLLAVGSLPGWDRKEKKQKAGAAEPFALVAGTVYRPPGFGLPGAAIVVTAETISPKSKYNKLKVVSDSRGEWTVRVPPVPMRYVVDVKIEGYQPQRKIVSVEGEQRYDLSFLLNPVSEAKGAVQ